MDMYDLTDFDTYDLGTGFEPITRTRSNTWPRPDVYIGEQKNSDEAAIRNKKSIETENPTNLPSENRDCKSTSRCNKKSYRKNAQGNLSYAELITQAITSTKNQRLTLSQIYDWMLENVPSIKSKGNNNSNAGWKNSIRHNLSLHNRFIRVPNEGTGKSSWWTVNLNEKLGKATRRRATSMEVSNCKESRSRARKQAESLKKQIIGSQNVSHTRHFDTTPSQSLLTNIYSFVTELTSHQEDMEYNYDFDNYQINTFEPRTASCISNFGGRLNPIAASQDEYSYDSNEKSEQSYQLESKRCSEASHTSDQTIPRNNSLLDDIDDIIRKEQQLMI